MSSLSKTSRIVFLIGSMGKGGAERVISILANNYAERGWKVDIIMLLDNRCEYQLHKSIELIPIFNKKSRIMQLPKWLFNIRKYILKNNPDVVVSFIARINIITIFACIGLNQRIVVSERNDPRADGRSNWVRLATYLLYPLAKCIVFQTKWAQSCFSKRIQNKSIIIPNPVHITIEASQIKERKIVAVGRLLEQKNHAMLIRAFKKVHNVYPDYKLYIYGEGKLRGILTQLICDLNLTEAVFLPGSVSDIHVKIADAEMFVLSSDYEGLSNALLEAMMMGIPCISTDCAGSNEVIIHEENGLLVPVGSANKVAEAIERLIVDKEFAKKLGNNAQITAAAFDSFSVLKKWNLVIE